MTSSYHKNGTERIAEAAKNIDADIVVNVQGDEALVNPTHIDVAVNALIKDQNVNVAILVNQFSKRNSPSDIKTVLDEENNVMYLSRSDIPSDTRTKNPPMLKAYHILPFRKEFLLKYASWEKGYLEQIEYHEHLRILEKGYNIRAVRVDSHAISVDTKQDLITVRKLMKTDKLRLSYTHPL
jgi:3-deoxy-manno-octulosonate cytidylyltransferase (CMP-KDO synthetase)